jgi:Asp-tRNA(Asn)/Glu-tRNA(Gln) amidotransferase A subunit family amidase
MTRTVEDACLVLEAISGLTDRYAPSLHSGDLSGLRLLAPTNLTDWQGKPLLNYGQQESLRASFNVLRRLGADVVEAPVAEDFVDLDRDEEAFNHPMEIEYVAAIREYLVSLRQ